jgi:hypothetical protein
MGQMADDMVDGTTCQLCGCFFQADTPGELYVHGYPVVCWDCWKDSPKQDRKQYQRSAKPSIRIEEKIAMSESKFTPGPWRIRFGGTTQHDGWCVESANASEGRVVAEYWPRFLPSRKQMIADAHLIAAAPELLEACIEALYWLDVSSRGEEECAKKLHAAIVKAEGKA